jgi:hypothetical protein
MAKGQAKPTDEELMAHVRSLGLDRWSSLRHMVEMAVREAETLGKRDAATTLRHVLQWMDDSEATERAAFAVKRAERDGDLDGVLKAFAQLP